jgi:SAM-dependent methyltransferase
VGCIPGHITYCLHEEGYPTFGVDIEPERMSESLRDTGLEIRKCNIERDTLPFEDNQFSIVLFSEIFEHLRIDPIFALEELHRVTSNDGFLILTTPHLYSYLNLYSLLLSRKGINPDPYEEYMKLRELGHMGHVREYSRSEVVEFLEQIGFETVNVSYRMFEAHGRFPYRHGKLKPILPYLLEWFPFLKNYLVVISTLD